MRASARLAILALAPPLLAAGPAGARTARLSPPARHQRLTAGQTIDVEWPADAAPEGTEEMELVLSLDGGFTFPVRVTGELPPGTTHAEFRVPSLSCRRARLALRAGEGEDEDESEEIRAVSDEFEIRPDPSSSREDLLRVRGEWRTREAVALPLPAGPAPPGLGAEPALVRPLGEEPAEAPDGSETLDTSRQSSPSEPSARAESPLSRQLPSSRPPSTSIPLRL